MLSSVSDAIKERDKLNIDLSMYRKYLDFLCRNYNRDIDYIAYQETCIFFSNKISAIEDRLRVISTALETAEIEI